MTIIQWNCTVSPSEADEIRKDKHHAGQTYLDGGMAVLWQI